MYSYRSDVSSSLSTSSVLDSGSKSVGRSPVSMATGSNAAGSHTRLSARIENSWVTVSAAAAGSMVRGRVPWASSVE